MQGKPHPDPPSVPPPAAGSAAEKYEASRSAKTCKRQRICARLWFARGFWWFRSPRDGSVWEISSLMRELRYDRSTLAHALHLSDRSFDRLVSDEMGPSAGAWLRSLRAVEFRLRVRTGEAIRKLAEDYGFKHQTDFTAEFRRWYEVSPRKYLKDFRNANPGLEPGKG